MVTVSHQQSRLTPTCRALFEAGQLAKLGRRASDADHLFTIGGISFATLDHADSSAISLTIANIQEGRTAAIVPHHLILPQAIFFDMDATVIEEESLVEIAKAAGKNREIEEMTTSAMAGQMDFKESLKARLALLRGVERRQVLSVSPNICKGMLQLSQWCHDRKIPMFLVSGGFVDLAEPVARQLGFKDFRANRFAWNGDQLAGTVDGDIVDAEGKRLAISEWCRVHQLQASRCIAIGDGANDKLMMDFCGLAVGYSPKKVLWEHLEVANHSGDHRFLVHALAPIKKIPD